MILDYPSGIGNIFLYLSKFFENDLFYGVDNFVQISEKDVSLYQKFIGNVSEINTIDYFYEHKNDKKIDVLISKTADKYDDAFSVYKIENYKQPIRIDEFIPQNIKEQIHPNL